MTRKVLVKKFKPLGEFSNWNQNQVIFVGTKTMSDG